MPARLRGKGKPSKSGGRSYSALNLGALPGKMEERGCSVAPGNLMGEGKYLGLSWASLGSAWS